MSVSSALKSPEAANQQSPRSAALSVAHRAAAPHPEAPPQTPPVACPATAPALPANAPCSPSPYPATTCWPYSCASPATKHRPFLPAFALRPLLFPASPATSAPTSHHPPPRCSAGIAVRSIATTRRP